MSEIMTNLPNGSNGLDDDPSLEVYTRLRGERVNLPMPVVRDEKAGCCSITSALFTSFQLDLVSDPVEDGHSCCHTSRCTKVVELTLHRDAITYVFAFCVVEGSEMVAVMTGRESCWSQPVRHNCVAAVAPLWTDEEAELMRQIQEEEYTVRMERECEEARLRDAAEFQAMTERDRARQEQQRLQQEQQQQQQAQADQAQAGHAGQQPN